MYETKEMYKQMLQKRTGNKKKLKQKTYNLKIKLKAIKYLNKRSILGVKAYRNLNLTYSNIA